MKVLCTGNMVFDILVRPVVEPANWAGTTLVESIEQSLGGNGANTSYTLGTLGIPARLLSMAGADPFGAYVLGRLRGAGVDTSGVRTSVAPTSTTVVLVNGSGERRFLHRLGSAAEIEYEPGEFEQELRAGITHYHLATPFSLTRMRRRWPELLRPAKALGIGTSLDTQWDSQGRWMEDLAPCLPYVDVLFLNEDEARMLAGSVDPPQVARVLRESGAQTIVLKLGARGCAVFTEDGAEREVPGFQVPVVDTTGAGDCFAGGYVAALLRGKSHAEAARFANAVGALTVRKMGGVDGLRGWSETEEWMVAADRRVSGLGGKPQSVEFPIETPEWLEEIRLSVEREAPLMQALLRRAISAVLALSALSEDSVVNATAAPTDLAALVRALSSHELLEELKQAEPLAPAFIRGIEAKQRMIEENGGTLTAQQVAQMIGISRQAVEKRRQAHKLLALATGRHGYRYPVWQFTDSGTLPGMEEVLTVLAPHDEWMQMVFFVGKNPRLHGQTPVEMLKAGKLKPVLDAAQIYGEHGSA